MADGLIEILFFHLIGQVHGLVQKSRNSDSGGGGAVKNDMLANAKRSASRQYIVAGFISQKQRVVGDALNRIRDGALIGR